MSGSEPIKIYCLWELSHGLIPFDFAGYFGVQTPWSLYVPVKGIKDHALLVSGTACASCLLFPIGQALPALLPTRRPAAGDHALLDACKLRVATAGSCGLTGLLIVHIFVGTRHVNDLIADAVSGVRSGRRATTPVRPDSQSPFPLVRPRHQTLKSSRKSSEDPNEFRCTYISISQTAYLVTKLDLPIRQEEKGTKVYPSTEDYVILNVYFFLKLRSTTQTGWFQPNVHVIAFTIWIIIRILWQA